MVQQDTNLNPEVDDNHPSFFFDSAFLKENQVSKRKENLAKSIGAFYSIRDALSHGRSDYLKNRDFR
jgi:hypothetical protein